MFDYDKQDFRSNQLLKAEHLNYLENGIEKVFNTIEEICPPLNLKDDLISCYPLEGVSLNPKSYIEPLQEGSGEPSPDNICPISGWNQATLTRCGKNLLPFPYRRESVEMNGGKFVVQNDGGILASGTPTTGVIINLYMGKLIGNGVTTFVLLGESTNVAMDVSLVDSKNNLVYNKSVNTPITLNYNDYPTAKTMQIGIKRLRDNVLMSGTVYPMVVAGTDVTDDFELYQDDTYTAQFGETVYGGTYDWNTGELMITHQKIELTGTEYWSGYGKEGEYKSYSIQIPDGTNEKGIEAQCSHYPNVLIFGDLYYGNIQACYVGNNNTSTAVIIIGTTYKTATEFKAYLAEQYAAGTPVTVVYQLAEPYVLTQLTPQQIFALNKINNVWSDVGKTKISSFSDPSRIIEQNKEAIEDLKIRVTTLEEAVVKNI